MKILSIDTSALVFSIALTANETAWYLEIDSGSNSELPRHSELIMDCIDNLFKTAYLKPEELNMVSCMNGPGSFTGLRIGFSAAKGISLALGIPLVAIPTLDCHAYPYSTWPGLIVPVIDAKKNCFFTAFYRNGERITEYTDSPPLKIAEEIGKIRFSREEQVFLTGPGSEALYNELSLLVSVDYINFNPVSRRSAARELNELAKCTKINEVCGANSGPIYLRKSDAELNWSK